MELRFVHQGNPVTLTVEPIGDGWRMRLPDGAVHVVSVERMPDGLLQIREGARTFRLATARTERGIEISPGGETWVFQPARGRTGRTARSRAGGALTAPMAGIVADVMVTAGQTVEAYQPLAAIEAMKVYATIEAPVAGTVTAVHVAQGQQVAQGAPVVEIQAAAETGEPG